MSRHRMFSTFNPVGRNRKRSKRRRISLALIQFGLSVLLLFIAGRSFPLPQRGPTDTAVRLAAQPDSASARKISGGNSNSSVPAPEAKPNPADPAESRASAEFAEGDQLLSEWNETSLRQSIKRFMDARSAWRDSRPDRATDALRSAARVHFFLGEYSEALKLNTEAAAESDRNGDRLRAMAALSAVGQAYSALGRSDRARQRLEEVLLFADRNAPAYGSTEEQRLAAEGRNYLGEVYYTEGTSIKALTYFKRALELFTELGDSLGQAQARLNIGYASSASGSQQEALAQFNQAMELFRTVNDPRGAALALTAIGSVYSLQGNEQAALDSHRQAMTMFRTVGDRHGEGVTLNAIGQAYEDLGEKQAALDNYTQSLIRFEQSESVGFASVSEYKIAKIHRSLGNFDQAFVHYDRCIQLSRAVGKRRIEAYALKDIAEIYSSQKKRSQTFNQYRKILDLYRDVGDFRGQAITLNSIGDLHFAAGEKDQALIYYKRALPLMRSAGDRDGEIPTLFAIGRTARDSNRLEEALSYVEQSIKIIEALRIYVASPELRTSYFAAVHENYDLYIQILMRLDQERPGHGYASLALQASESGRARALIEVLTEARADLRQGMNPKQLQQLRDLQASLAAKERNEMELSNSPETQTEAAEVAREIRQLTSEEQTLQAQIRQQNPRYAALMQPKPLSLEQIQAELRDEDTLLLEYALGDDKSYLWAVTQNSFESFELPGRATLEGAAREVYDLLTARQRFGEETNYDSEVARADSAYSEKALALRRMLLGPVEPLLGKKRLLIVADGVLQYLPFEALPTPQVDSAGTVTEFQPDAIEQPLLVADHEVVTLPSISVLAAMRREMAVGNSSQKVVSILADPVFAANDQRVVALNKYVPSEPGSPTADLALALRDFDLFGKGKPIPRLPFTLVEANAILNLTPSGQANSATDFDANRASVLNSEIEDYQIIHFATHSLINSDKPQLSGILLSMVDRRGAPQNGFLQLRDIYNLKLSAKLVVLSACSSGLGKDVKGEGLIGLTRGFMYAGSKSVVASLWKVDDRATSELMTRFYSAMLKDNLSPAAALRVAKESLRREKRWRAPYFWAGFMIQGEYREHIQIEASRPWFVYILAGLLTTLLGAYGIYVMRGRRKSAIALSSRLP